MISQLQKVSEEAFAVQEATHPWNRQIGETPLAYRLFAVYRDQGINRDIREIAKDLGRGYRTVKNLSIENQWEMRAGSYDDHQNRALEKKLQYEIVDARKRHHRLGSLILDFARESIENLRSMGDLLSVKDVVLLAETGSKLESTALGMASEITESRVAADIQVKQTETIPAEILEKLGREIAAAKSLGESTEEIEAEFEDIQKPFNLLVDGNGDGKVKIPVSI